MKVPFFIARRYVKPHRFSVISVIGIVSVAGIVIGSASLVVIMSLFNGFRDVARDTMIGFGPHLQVVSAHSSSIHLSQNDLRALKVELADVTQGLVVSSVSTKLVIRSGGRTGVAFAVGVDDDQHAAMQGPARATFLGTFTTRTFEGMPSVTVSSGVAENLRLLIGDTVELIAPEMIERSVRSLSMPSGRKAVVRGMFQSNAARDIDQTRIYADNQLLTGLQKSKGVSSIDVMVVDPVNIISHVAAVTPLLPNNTVLRTWEDLNRGLVDTMKLERFGSFLILALIIVVASFNVLVSLTLGVVEKRRDIAVLMSIGLEPSDIRKIYLIQGLSLGVVSVFVGIGLGLLVCWGQQTFSWIQFDMTQGYLVPALPLTIEVGDVVQVAAVGLLLAGTAALYPASRASKTVIADAVRVE